MSVHCQLKTFFFSRCFLKRHTQNELAFFLIFCWMAVNKQVAPEVRDMVQMNGLIRLDHRWATCYICVSVACGTTERVDTTCREWDLGEAIWVIGSMSLNIGMPVPPSFVSLFLDEQTYYLLCSCYVVLCCHRPKASGIKAGTFTKMRQVYLSSF